MLYIRQIARFRSTSKAHRFTGGIAVLALLGAFVILPLCAALALCGMPCCHDARSVPASLSGVTACETECAVHSSEAAQQPVQCASGVDQGRGAVVAVFRVQSLDAVRAFEPARESETVPAHPAPAALNVLNSTFRI